MKKKESNFLKMHSFNSKILGNNYLCQKECASKKVKSHFEGACKLFKYNWQVVLSLCFSVRRILKVVKYFFFKFHFIDIIDMNIHLGCV